MGKIGEAARRLFFTLSAASTAFAAAEENAILQGGAPQAASTVGTSALENAFGDADEAGTALERASSLPDPGDDWILRKEREANVEAAANVGTNGDLDSEKGKTSERFAALADVAAVGKIVAIDLTGIETEDRRRDRRERTPKRAGDAILFLPPVDPSAAEAFCVEIREAPGARDRDRFWLRNGDEFDGELLRVDRRRVWIRAFDVEFVVPRGRVRAVRFAKLGGNEGSGGGEDGKRDADGKKMEAEIKEEE